MSNTKAVRELSVAGYLLSVTTRFVSAEDTPELLEELTFRTIGAFLHIARLIEAGKVEVGIEGSIESRLAAERNIELPESFTDSRITVWDVYRGSKRVNFILNSDDNLQGALNAHMANANGCARAEEKYGTPQNAPQANAAPTNPRETAPQVMNTHEAPNNAQNGVNHVKGYKDAKSLPIGSQFDMKVAKIKAAMNEDGVLTWRLFAFYGKQPGKFAEFTIFSDNDFANKSGLVAKLNAICSTAGMAVEGNWLASGNTSEGDDKTYVNITDVVQL